MNYNSIERIIEFFRLSFRIVFQGFYIFYLRAMILIKSCFFMIVESIWKIRLWYMKEKLAYLEQEEKNDRG